jgi:hypothetical protein
MNDLYGPLDEKKKKARKLELNLAKNPLYGIGLVEKAPKVLKKDGLTATLLMEKVAIRLVVADLEKNVKKYPACRPTPGACKERGKGKSWGKKAKSKKNEELYMDLEQIIQEELEAVLDEKEGKKDACYHKVKSRYKVWPSAYASGALVKCRKVGAKNWGNSKKEQLQAIIEDELTQVLFEKEENSDLKSKVVKALRDEGGAAGMDALEKHTKASKDEISKVVKNANNIKVHEDGDVILMDSLEESKTDKERMKCNSPRRIRKGEAGHGKKKFVVKACDGGTEKIIRYGDANMEIKKDSPARRKSFRARHNCKNPGSKLKARYWSCKKW